MQQRQQRSRSTPVLPMPLLLLLMFTACSVVHAAIDALAMRTTPPLYARVAMETTPDAGRLQGLTFKILQLADLHFTGDPLFPCRDAPYNLSPEQLPCTEALMSTFVDELLDTEKPDFVVFTGDNVQTLGPHDQQRAIDAFTRGVEQRQIPFAVVLGNHDDENGFAREDVLRMAMNKSMSYTQRGPLAVDGVGNYMLSVHAPVGGGAWGNASDPVLRLYFLDSGGYANTTLRPDLNETYDWIKPSQVQYYRNLSLAAQATQTKRQQTASATKLRSLSSAGTRAPLPPALMFFHIPLQEYNQSAARDWANRSGEAFEDVDASTEHSELFAALVERDEVKATFCGHDHLNEYCYNLHGIQLCYGGGAGFGAAYGVPKYTRRARVIEWNVTQHGARTVRSWKRLFGDVSRRSSLEVLFMQAAVESTGLATTANASSANSSAVSRSSSSVHARGSALSVCLWVVLAAVALSTALDATL